MQQAINLIDSIILKFITLQIDSKCDEEKQIESKDDIKSNDIQKGVKKSQWMKRVWSSYSSIVHLNEKVLKTSRLKGLNHKDIKWAVTEKVHGANFAIMYNGKEFGAASRNNLLIDDQFYEGWLDVVENEKPRIKKVYNILKAKNNKYQEIVIFGELFGGIYEHKDKQYRAKKGIKHVQKGIYYSPSLQFYAFDIKTNFFDKDINNKSELGQYSKKLEFNESLDIFKRCGFLYCEPLKIGTFEECITFDVDHLVSTIPNKLGLPPPCRDDGKLIENIAEGVVLRILCGKNKSLKIKSSKFAEITKMSKSHKKKVLSIGKANDIKNKGMNEHNINIELFDYIDRCINENKYETVMSKVGTLTTKNIYKIMGMMIGDVFQDLKKEYNEIQSMDNEKKILKQYCKFGVQEFFIPKLYQLQMNN